MLALLFKDEKIVNYLVLTAAKERLILFWLLFEPRAVRISPPLTISMKEITEGCDKIIAILKAYKPTAVN